MENDIITPELVDETLAVWDIRIGQANSLYTYATQEEQAASLHQRNAIMAGLQLGYMLTALKDSIAHGEWSKLFKGAAADRVIGSKSTSCGAFEFSLNVAQRYMSCYRKAVARLEDGQEQSRLDSLLGTAGAQEIVADPHYQDSRDLLSKATGGAESTRQMMLNLGVIKASSARPKLPQYETILANRNTKGRPVKPDATPETAIVQAIAATPSEEKMKEMAARDTVHIIKLLQELGTSGSPAYLTRDERKWFADQLREFAKLIDK